METENKPSLRKTVIKQESDLTKLLNHLYTNLLARRGKRITPELNYTYRQISLIREPTHFTVS